MFQGKFIDPLYLNEAVNHEANLNRDIYNEKKKIKNGASASFVAKLGPVSLPQRAHFQLIGLENFYWEGYIQ